MLVFKFFLVKHYFNGVIFAPLFLLSPLNFIRRQELRELRFLQKEEQRAQQQLNGKLQQQREQIFRRFEQEMMVKSWNFVPFCS